jgi:RNA polymerase sigma-70 factor (ECF subfamily)
MSLPNDEKALQDVADENDGAEGPCASLTDAKQILLTRLFQRYQRALFRHLKSLVSSHDDAADLVQECYARLLRHPHAVQSEDAAWAYLHRTATNLARDHFRRRMSHQADHHVDIEGMVLPADEPTPDRAVAWDETIASIKQGLLRLPTLTRRVYILSRFRGKTYSQIAAILGISSRTVERKMSEAMEELALRIGETL